MTQQDLMPEVQRRAVTPEMTAAEVAFLARELRLCSGSRVLDVRCGFGRHALALAGDPGCDVEGSWTASAPTANIWRMERQGEHQEHRQDSETTAAETDSARLARIRRDLALTPSQRLDKFAALWRQADALRRARRLP